MNDDIVALTNVTKESSKFSALNAGLVLQNINLNIKKGECVGIFGEQGAGKSTLLKIISGITFSTSGVVKVNGKTLPLIDSFLQCLHYEMTVRENLYFYCALVGINRAEINSKLKEIMIFSGIKDFIDLKYKYCPFAKKNKLFLSLALFSEHKILLLDNIFPISDKTFSMKVYSKIDELKKKGSTIFIASEQIDNIKKLCTRCILIEKGKISFNGPHEDLILDPNNNKTKIVEKATF